jgi:Zn-dependent protease
MFDQVTIFIFKIAVLIFSTIIHEISHGFSAKIQGDDTAESAGRLTLNPIPHLDLFGSIILPVLLALPVFLGMSGVIIGWAKPVPFNPNNLRNKRWGPALVAIAGPASNIFIALIFGTFLRFFGAFPGLPSSLIIFIAIIVLINLLLAIFNLVPIPPLDGSKILFSILPQTWPSVRRAELWLEQYGFVLILLFIFFGFNLILPIIYLLFGLFTGQTVGL